MMTTQNITLSDAARDLTRCRAFTLQELLAVVTILAMVTSYSLMTLSAGSVDVAALEAIHDWQRFDSRARLLSHGQGPLVIGIDNTESPSTAWSSPSDTTGKEITRGELAIGSSRAVTCDIIVNRRPAQSVHISREGRSTDYLFVVRSNQDNQGAMRAWRFYGLTGHMARLDREEMRESF